MCYISGKFRKTEWNGLVVFLALVLLSIGVYGKKQKTKYNLEKDKELASIRYEVKWKRIRSGEKVKGGINHKVLMGQSLNSIAKAYGVSIEKIKEANPHIKTDYPFHGTTIFIPGVEKVVAVPTPQCPTPVNFRRVGENKVVRVRLLNCFGKVRNRARIIISKLAADRRTNNYKLLHPALFIILQKLSDHWPNSIIEIVSGYREPIPGHRSNHYIGRAIDFRVSGVSREKVRDFLRQFKKVGVGYYPNSVFVHLDVRDKGAYWIDISRPGEPPQYVKDYEIKDIKKIDEEIEDSDNLDE